MQVDRERDRPLEVETIIGEPLRAARENGVSTPAMEMLYNGLILVNKSQI
jgi:ketopantoate reductase